MTFISMAYTYTYIYIIGTQHTAASNLQRNFRNFKKRSVAKCKLEIRKREREKELKELKLEYDDEVSYSNLNYIY